jgi:hypothetical protein
MPDIFDSLLGQLPGWPTTQRIYPPPSEAWMLYQQWDDLLFAHWPVPVELLRRAVPSALPIDTFDGQAWIGITPFLLTGMRARLMPPVPGLSDFPELNVRTYVTVGDRPGVYFFSLDAGNPAAVAAARQFFLLPYHSAAMNVRADGPYTRYLSRRLDTQTTGDPEAEFEAWYRPVGEVYHAKHGTLDHFLTERYCLYTVDNSGAPHRAEIHHGPWPLQKAEGEIERNTMTHGLGIALPDEKPLLHYARHQPTVAWPLQRVEQPHTG